MPIAPHDPEEFGSNVPAPFIGESTGPNLIPGAPEWRERGRRAIKIGSTFVVGQGAALVLNAAANLFLVHTLSIEAYAQFGLALAFQNTFSVLMDLGFANTIVPLVADRTGDKALIGRYVRSANHLRNYSFALLAPIGAILFWAIMRRHQWSAGTELMLILSVLIALYSGGTMSYFSAPLFIFGRLNDFYLPQAIFGLVRLAVLFLLAIASGLNAWTAALVTALTVTATAGIIRRRSSGLFIWPKRNSRAVNREVLQYILPASPAIILAAFQQQIALFLVSIFGGTLYIAQVAALTRIGQFSILFTTFASVVVEPYVARLQRERLLRIYIFAIFGATLICIPLVFTAFKWPDLYIWIIGKKYEGVRDVIGWYVLSLSMNAVSGLVWVMNRARKWVFWSGSMLEVVLLLVSQVCFYAVVGVQTTRDAVNLLIVASFCYAIAHGYVAVLGFVRGPRLQPAS